MHVRSEACMCACASGAASGGWLQVWGCVQEQFADVEVTPCELCHLRNVHTVDVALERPGLGGVCAKYSDNACCSPKTATAIDTSKDLYDPVQPLLLHRLPLPARRCGALLPRARDKPTEPNHAAAGQDSVVYRVTTLPQKFTVSRHACNASTGALPSLQLRQRDN